MGEKEIETEPDTAEPASPDVADSKKPAPVPAESEPEAKQVSMVDKANEAAARLERANVEHAKIVARQEALAVEKTLGGTAEAGTPAKEDTPEEYAKKVMANDVEKV